MNTIADGVLSLFCAREDGRYAISQPFIQGGFRYCTDGIICLRFKADGEPDTVTDKRLPKVDFFDNLKGVAEFFPWPAPMPCEECDDTGIVESEDKICSECDGTGSVTCNYGEDHDCPDCDGSGEGEGIIKQSCDKCRNQAVVANGCRLARKYVNRVALLGAVEFAPLDRSQVYFRWADGDGLLMQLSKDQP